MAIKVYQNNYIAPALERQANETNRFADLSVAINNVAKVGSTLVKYSLESQDEATKQKVNQEISEYNVEATRQLKEYKASGERDIQSKMEEWSKDYKDMVLSRNKKLNGFDKYWNQNVYRVDNPMRSSIYDAQLEVDSVNETNDRNIQFDNNLIATRADPNGFHDNAEMSFNSVDQSKYMPADQKIKEYNNIALQQQTTAYLATVDRDGVEAANLALLNGDFNLTHIDNKGIEHTFSLLNKVSKNGNSVAATLIKSAEDTNFSAILKSDNLALLKATKEEWDSGKRYGKNDVYALKGVGTIWGKKEKEYNYSLLNKAIKNQQLSLEDQVKQSHIDLVLAARQGDFTSAQKILVLASNGDKTAEKYLPYLKEKVPVLCETKEESFRGLTTRLEALSKIDIDAPVTETSESGKTQYKKAIMEILQYIDDRNQNTKDLSPEDRKTWSDMILQLNDNIGQNIEGFVDGLQTVEAANTQWNTFLANESFDPDLVPYSAELPTASDFYPRNIKKTKTNKKLDTFSANKYVRTLFEIEKRYPSPENALDLQRKEALLKEAKNAFLTEKRLQVAPELYWADSPSNYKIHSVGDKVTVNNREYILRGWEGLIFPVLSPAK